MADLAKELRVMHACEIGAVGVYRGHRCIARYFFRTRLEDIDSMRYHEREHSEVFSKLLSERNFRQCHFSFLWFWGGLLYGVLIGVFGLKAIGKSTVTIENIVDHEFDNTLDAIKEWPELCAIIRTIQFEERDHKAKGEGFSGGDVFEKSVIKSLAKAGAYTAKYLAEVL